MNAPFTSYKLILPLLLALFCLPAVQAAQNPVGGILSSVGEVKAINQQGVARPLSKGASITQGDTIHTAQNARAQLRFSDGAMVALQPDSQFRIDEYQFAGKEDGQEKGFFSLIKGGLRTITGWVGRSNRDNYKLSTTVATIGIRGTGYSVFITPDNALHASVGEGSIAVSNEAGTLVLDSGESAIVERPGAAPQRIAPLVYLPPTQPEDIRRRTFTSSERYARMPVQGNVQLAADLLENPSPTTPTPDPTPTPPPTPGPTPPVHNTSHAVHYIAAYAAPAPAFAGGQVDPPYEFDGNNKLVKIDKGGVATPLSQSAGNYDDVLYYGTWSGIDGGTYAGGASALHYLAGTPVMPTANARYDLLSGPASLAFARNADTVSLRSGQLKANFTSAPLLALQMEIAAGTSIYAVNGTTTDISVGRFAFAGQSVSMPSGSSNASFDAKGFFTGSSANYAGMSFDFERPDLASDKAIEGIAAFQKYNPPPPVLNTGHDVHYAVKYEHDEIDSGKLDAPYEFDSYGAKLVKFDKDGVATPLSQSAGNIDGILYYGTWNGINGGDYDGSDSLFHYLAGTPVMPTASASYNLLSGPASLALAENADQASILEGFLNTTFSAAPRLELGLKIAAGSSNYLIDGSSTDISGGRFKFDDQQVTALSSGTSNHSFDAKGFFAGSSASHAGLSFAFERPDLADDKEIAGIAAFQKNTSPPPPPPPPPPQAGAVLAYYSTAADWTTPPLLAANGSTSSLTNLATFSETTPAPSGTVYTRGAGGVHDAGNENGVIYWGKWVDGSIDNGAGQQPLTHLLYVAGNPVAPTGTSTATYSVASGFLYDGVNTGVISAGGITLDFGDRKISVNMSTWFDLLANGYSITASTSYVGSPPATFSMTGGSVESVSGGATNNSFRAQGMFAGTDASHAGLVFSFIKAGEVPDKSVTGVAVFKK